MRRMIAAVSVACLVSAGGIAASAFAAGGPEVDEANASIQLPSTTFTSTSCAGEDGVKYVTYRGSWKGGETDLTPGSTDYNLSGNLAIKKVVWTINLTTDRGLLTGAATLKSPNAAGALTTTYSGPLTLVTQGLPDATAGNGVQARGWIDAPTYTASATDGGSLLANVEMQINPGFSANGEFGNQTMGFNDISVTWNGLTC